MANFCETRNLVTDAQGTLWVIVINALGERVPVRYLGRLEDAKDVVPARLEEEYEEHVNKWVRYNDIYDYSEAYEVYRQYYGS